ncbi:MAG TPA: methyltransferase domain-containing protein [Polyangiaceae bacterium]|nr:methyltransferase domain-containing protein [Polyangiaceae bacterium]
MAQKSLVRRSVRNGANAGIGPPAGSEKHRTAIIERLRRRSIGAGSFSAPCIPSLAEHYFSKLMRLFDALDRPLESAERAAMRRAFDDCVAEGFASSPYARFVLAYRPADSNPLALDCTMSVESPSLDEQYQDWLEGAASRQPFGTHPDAMVVQLAGALAEAGPIRVLDVGAGSGRNALPLARAAHAVDAVEPVAALAGQLREAARAEALEIRLFEEDFMSEQSALDAGGYDLVVLSEVSPHFSRRDFGRALPRLSRLLAASGTLLFNAFIAKRSYRPDAVAQETAQSVWSTFFTRDELEALTSPLGLVLARDEACVEFERANLPKAAWPPTSWYVNWAQGRNLFGSMSGDTPIELRWLAYRKQSSERPTK